MLFYYYVLVYGKEGKTQIDRSPAYDDKADALKWAYKNIPREIGYRGELCRPYELTNGKLGKICVGDLRRILYRGRVGLLYTMFHDEERRDYIVAPTGKTYTTDYPIFRDGRKPRNPNKVEYKGAYKFAYVEEDGYIRDYEYENFTSIAKARLYAIKLFKKKGWHKTYAHSYMHSPYIVIYHNDKRDGEVIYDVSIGFIYYRGTRARLIDPKSGVLKKIRD